MLSEWQYCPGVIVDFYVVFVEGVMESGQPFIWHPWTGLSVDKDWLLNPHPELVLANEDLHSVSQWCV